MNVNLAPLESTALDLDWSSQPTPAMLVISARLGKRSLHQWLVCVQKGLNAQGTL
jgi:hypothetical protein